MKFPNEKDIKLILMTEKEYRFVNLMKLIPKKFLYIYLK